MRKKKIILAVILCISALAMSGCGGKETSSNQTNVQKQAEEFFANGDYEKARELYKDAGNEEMVSECTYLIAKNCLEQKDYTSAIKEFETIPDYKDTADYLDKCRMELKYEKFDYDSFTTLGDDSVATMTNKEIREYIEECMNSMYSSWYQQNENNESIIIDKYYIDGKEYGISSWGGEGNYTEFDIYYMDDTENKIHISLTPDFAYMNVSEQPTMMLSIGDMWYFNYTSSQAKEYAELSEAQQEKYENAQTTEHYLPCHAECNSFDVYVHYAGWGVDSDSNISTTVIGCTIKNSTASNLQFVASNYFSLNNEGIIVSALPSEYDYTTLAPNGSINTIISFERQSSANSLVENMILMAENVQIHLGPAPQTEDEKHQFVGTYYCIGVNEKISYTSKMIVSDMGNGTYKVIRIHDYDVSGYSDVTVDGNNLFFLNNGEYLWDPDKYAIFIYDEEEECIDESYDIYWKKE